MIKPAIAWPAPVGPGHRSLLRSPNPYDAWADQASAPSSCTRPRRDQACRRRTL